MYRVTFILTIILFFLDFYMTPTQNSSKTINVKYLTGRYNPHQTKTKNLHPEVYQAFLKMQECANKEGIDLQIVSGYRSYQRQLGIWNAKYRKFKKKQYTEQEIIKKIMTYSAVPGTSRHHWGTDIDLIDANTPAPKSGLLNTENYAQAGNYHKMYKWMQNNAENFDFYLVYTDDSCRMGYKFEPWHYSYKPISKKLLKAYSKLDYKTIIQNNKLLGNSLLDSIFLDKYYKTHLTGIHPALLPN